MKSLLFLFLIADGRQHQHSPPDRYRPTVDPSVPKVDPVVPTKQTQTPSTEPNQAKADEDDEKIVDEVIR